MTLKLAPMLSRRGISFAVLAATLAVSWLVYGGNQHHALLHWDDITYVSTNSWITNPSLHFLQEIFTRSRLGNWHPLTWISYIPEYALCGATASCYKSTNITLHGLNAFLVFWLSREVLTLAWRETRDSSNRIVGASLIAALLFVAHPQHVESVIWVAERKDLLCAGFFMLSMIFYLRQHAGPDARSTPLPYLFFALAALSKSMAVTLPAVLIVLDLAPLSRFHRADWRRLVRIALMEKMHFHLTSILLVLVTLLTQKVDTLEAPTLLDRLRISTSALQHYLTTFLLPFDLSPFYPSALVAQQSGLFLMMFAAAMVLTVIAAAVRFGNRFIAWFAYLLVTLAPVIGLVKVGEQAFADRYTYLPLVGFYVVAGVALVSLRLPKPRRLFFVSALTLVTVLGLGTNSRTYKDVWQSDLYFWQYISDRYAGLSATIHSNLGNSYFFTAQYEQATTEYEKAIAIDPRRVGIYGNLGMALEFLNKPEQALEVYGLAIERNPDSAWAYIQAGMAHARLGSYRSALNLHNAGLQRSPDNTYALFGAGRAALITGDPKRAIAFLERIPSDSLRHLEAQLLIAEAYLQLNPKRSLEVLGKIEQRYGPVEGLASIRARIP